MLHTGHLLIPLTKYHIAFKENRHGKYRTFNKIILENGMVGIKARQYYVKENSLPKCSIIFDATKILKTGLIVESDYYRIKSYIKRALGIVYGDEDLFDSHNLVRIDYRYDIKVTDATKRSLYLYLYNKTRRHYRRLKKHGLENYRTSIYHQCNAIETILYSKNEECEAKGRTPEEWEQDVMRFEVRLKNAHLYNQTKKTGEAKCLFTFFKQNKYAKYMQGYLLKIYPSGDFYSFNAASNLIRQSDYSLIIKNRLKEFLRSVANGTLDSPKNTIYSKAISEDTWRMRIGVYNTINVNPITIPMNRKVEHLPNLLNNLLV